MKKNSWRLAFSLTLLLAAVPLHAEYRLFDLLDEHAAIMLLLDPDSGDIADANEAAAAFYGYSVAELRSMNIRAINMLDDKKIAAELERARIEERSYFIFPHRKADGCVVTVEVYSSPVVQPDTGRRFLLSIIHDIGGKHIEERVMEEYRQNLNDLLGRKADQLASSRVLSIGASSAALSLLALGLVLALSIREQRKGARALERALSEKTALFKELQHRVKNSLATMASIVSIEADLAESDEARAALTALNGRIDTMASLYEHMHASEMPEALDAGAYLRAIAEGIYDACGASPLGPALHIDIDSCELDSKRASGLGLIANELLTNAIKHGLGGASAELSIAFKKIGDELLLSVRNNGPPLPPGFSLVNQKGFGLIMASELAAQLGGALGCSSDDGVVFYLRFPFRAPD
jgi:PAS domain S-box-containing protein